MNRRSRISFGPGAASLILVVVILSMSVLGILALMNARNDSKLSARSVQVVQAGYALNVEAEQQLAKLDAIAAHYAEIAEDDEAYALAVRTYLPADMELADRVIRWSLTDGYRMLDCAVALNPLGEAERFTWVNHRLTAITEEEWN